MPIIGAVHANIDAVQAETREVLETVTHIGLLERWKHRLCQSLLRG